MFGYFMPLVQELQLMVPTTALCRKLLAAGPCTDYLLFSGILLLIAAASFAALFSFLKKQAYSSTVDA